MFEKEIIKLYKERGIDIEEIDTKIRKLYSEIDTKRARLGEALEKDSSDIILKEYKKELEELFEEIYTLTIQRANLLENSFEKTLEYYIIKCLAYLSLEIKKENSYANAFASIEEFLEAEDEIISKAITYAMAIHNI